MVELLALARKIAPTDTLVLFTGETGTDKEVLARAIHDASPQAGQPVVPFNGSGFPRDLVESQLLGYRRNAFTGAASAFEGVIRAAARGALFLDEVGEFPVSFRGPFPVFRYPGSNLASSRSVRSGPG